MRNRNIYFAGISFLDVKGHDHNYKIDLFERYFPDIVKKAESSFASSEEPIIIFICHEYALLKKDALNSKEKNEILDKFSKIIKKENVILIPGSLAIYKEYPEYYKKIEKIRDNYKIHKQKPEYKNDSQFLKNYNNFKNLRNQVEDCVRNGKSPAIQSLRNSAYLLLFPDLPYCRHDKSAIWKEEKKLKPNQKSFFVIGADNPIKKVSIQNQDLKIGLTICREHDGFITDQTKEVQDNDPHIQILISDFIEADPQNFFGGVIAHNDTEYGFSVHVDVSHWASSTFNEIQADYYHLTESECRIEETPIDHFYKPLYKAAESGDDENVEKFLKDNAPIILKNNLTNPLHLAVKNKHYKIAELLLKHGVDVNLKMTPKCDVLTLAIKNNDVDMIKLLLKSGADVNSSYALFESIKKGNLEIFEKLLEKADPNRRLSNGKSLLHKAVIHKQHKIAELLLNKGVNVDLQMKPGFDALTLAAKNNDLDMLNLLLDNKADPNLGNVFFVAAMYGYLDIFKILIDRINDINEESNIGTLLYVAAKYGHLDIVNLLLEKGARPNLGLTKQDLTPLHIASEKGNYDIVEVLLKASVEKGIKDLHIQSKSGETALHLAVKNKNYKVVQLLLTYKAPVNLRMKSEITALTLAAENKDLDMINLLLDNNADPNFGNVFFVAAMYGNLEIFKALINKIDNINVESNIGTSLYIAARYGHLDIVNLLLEKGAKPNLGLTKKALTPLHVAAEKGNYDIVKALLKASVEKGIKPIHTQSTSGETALHLAVKNKHHKVAQKLITYKAPVNLEMEPDVTALTLAAENNDLDMVNLLLENKADPNFGYPLFQAIILGDLTIVNTLVKQKSINLQLGMYFTREDLLEFASKEDWLEFAQKNKIEELSEIVNERSKNEICIYPIELAEVMGNTEIKDVINQAIEDRKVLTSKQHIGSKF